MPTGDVLAFSRKGSFEAVVLPHLDAAHNLARWLTRDAEAAEDVLQDAIVRALTYFPTFKGINPGGWLLQIVRNTAYTSKRSTAESKFCRSRCRRMIQSALPQLFPRATTDDPEASLIKTRGHCHIRQLIAALPLELRETLLEELSYKENSSHRTSCAGAIGRRLSLPRHVRVRGRRDNRRAELLFPRKIPALPGSRARGQEPHEAAAPIRRRRSRCGGLGLEGPIGLGLRKLGALRCAEAGQQKHARSRDACRCYRSASPLWARELARLGHIVRLTGGNKLSTFAVRVTRPPTKHTRRRQLSLSRLR
jgi:RNA polymerase sigma-70 factor (ECF subfamily)